MYTKSGAKYQEMKHGETAACNEDEGQELRIGLIVELCIDKRVCVVIS